MAESKQYITQPLENGNVLISEDVLSTIVSQALADVDGVIGLSVKPGADIAEIIGKKSWGKGMKISILPDNSLRVDCNILIAYGQSVVSVAKTAQETVSSALESMANIKVATVNINVCGIVRQ